MLYEILLAALVQHGVRTRPANQGLRSYKTIDNYLVFLSAAYMPGLNDWDQNRGILQMYFLGMLIQPITVWSVEAYRKRNMLTPISLYVPI